MAALVLLFDRSGLLPFAVLAVLTHELGHVAVIYAMGGRVEGFHLGLAGLAIHYEGRQIGYLGEIGIALAGSLANFALAYIGSVWGGIASSESLFLLAGVNMGAGIFNLLPVYQLDGGRAVYCLLVLVLDGELAFRLVCVVSLAVILGLLGLGVWLLLWSGWNFTLLLVALWLLFGYCKNFGDAVKCARRTGSS